MIGGEYKCVVNEYDHTITCKPFDQSEEITLQTINDEDRLWLNAFTRIMFSLTFHLILIFSSFLTGYLTYQNLDGAIRYLSYVYILYLIVIVMSIPFVGIPFIVYNGILWKATYNLLLSWVGIPHTQLTVIVFWIFISFGIISSIIMTKIFWTARARSKTDE